MTTEGSTVDFSCDIAAGYSGSGGTITCGISGSWTALSGCAGSLLDIVILVIIRAVSSDYGTFRLP